MLSLHLLGLRQRQLAVGLRDYDFFAAVLSHQVPSTHELEVVFPLAAAGCLVKRLCIQKVHRINLGKGRQIGSTFQVLVLQ